MRKLNAILTVFILVLFLLHAVFGSFQIIGIGGGALKVAAWTALVLTVVHMVIGVALTWQTLKALKAAGVSYFKENKLFWARRISGFAIMLLIFFHLTAFGYTENGVYRLYWFTAAKLTTQILLVAAIAVHVITNVKPVLISFGIKSFKRRVADILIVLSVLILFMAVALVIYYLLWNA
jgi:succinate dehydrogenase hydrophobic anchor subunit